MKSFAIGGLLAGLALFLFGAVYWMSPVGMLALAEAPPDSVSQAALDEAFPATGSYFVPGQDHDREAWTAAHERGPIAVVHLRKEGLSPMSPTLLLRGLLHALASAFVLAFLMALVVRALPSYRSRLLFAGVVGLLASIFTNAGAAIWWYHSSSWTLVLGVYDVLAYLVMGAVLGAFVRPRPAT
jgi:hypothetical protein